MGDTDNLMETLDMYMEMVEKQDEIIYRMGKIISKQAYALQLLRNDNKYSDPKLDQEMAIVEDIKKDYEGYMKN